MKISRAITVAAAWLLPIGGVAPILSAQEVVVGRVVPAAFQDEARNDPQPEEAEVSESLPPPVVINSVPEKLPLPLSLADLEQIALANNPAMSRAVAQIAAARGNWVQVGLYPNPEIGYSGQEIGADGTAGQQGGYVGQEFVLGGKLRLSRAEASLEVRKAEQTLQTERLRVLTDVRVAYYDVLVAQRRLDVTSDLIGVGTRAVETSEKLLQVGEASELDLLQFRIQTEQARILAENAQNFYREAWQRLAAVIGIPAMPPTPLVGDLDQPGPEISWDGALGRLLATSPERARALAEAERARWAYQRARVEPVPNPTLQVGVANDAPTGDTLASVQLGIPLPLFNRNQGAIQRTYAEIAAAEQQAARIELGLQERLATVYRRYANARQQVQRYSNHILPIAERNLQLTRSSYEAGQVGYLNLLAAQQTYFQAVLSYIAALQEMWTATMEIEGLLLRGSLQADGGAQEGPAVLEMPSAFLYGDRQ
jgi:cobalt-zinc-cadmium efflux system outer membrane protein